MRDLSVTRRSWAIGAAACLVGWASLAAPLDEARQALQAGEYRRVDEILKRELTRQRPEDAVLRVSLEAAMKSGNFITANQRITPLLQYTNNKDGNLLFEAARLAELIGHDRLALARYLLFVQNNGGKSEKFEQACSFLFRNGEFPNEYRKFVELYGKSPAAWVYGIRMLEKVGQEADAASILSLATTLIDAFNDEPAKVGRVNAILRQAADAYLLGQSVEERYARATRVMLTGRPDDFGHVEHMLNASAAALKGEEKVALLNLCQKVNKRPLPHGMLRHYNAIGEIFDLEKRLQGGRDYLSFEPVYRDSANIDDYVNFLRVMVENPGVFNIFGQVLAGPEVMQKMLEALALKTGNDPGRLDFLLKAMFDWEAVEDKKLEPYKRNARLLTKERFAELMNGSDGLNLDQLVAQWLQGRDRKQQVDFLAHLMPQFNKFAKKDLLLRATREYLAVYPGRFSWQHVNSHFMASELCMVAEKCKLLEEVIVKGGAPSAPMTALLAEAAKTLNEEEAFKAIQVVYQQNQPGTDPAMALHVAACRVADNKADDLHKTIEPLLAAVQGKLPGGNERTTSTAEVAILDVAGRHFGAAWNNRDQIRAAALLWLPRLGLGNAYVSWLNRLREHGRTDAIYALAPGLVDNLKAEKNLDGMGNLLWNAAQAANPRDQVESVYGAVYDKLGARHAFLYLLNNRAVWDGNRQVFMAEVEKIAALANFQPDAGTLRDIVGQAATWTGGEVKLSVQACQKLFNRALELGRAGVFDPVTEANLHAILRRSGHEAAAATHLQAQAAEIGKRGADDQVQAWNALFVHGGLASEELGSFEPWKAHHLLLKSVRPAYERVGTGQWPAVAVPERVYLMAYALATDAKVQSPAERQEAESLLGRLNAMLAGGAGFAGHRPNILHPLRAYATRLLQDRQWEGASRSANYLAANLSHLNNWDAALRDWMTPLVDAADKAEAFEFGFVFVKIVQDGNQLGDDMDKKVAILRAKMAQGIPGLLTVDENDPTYDLQMAAFNLAIGNEGKAWELTATKLALLPKVWEVLDSSYVAWTIEQMRKQKRLDEALNMAFTVLLRERELEPSIAAQVSLTKGDIYRDRQNYQAARIEYEGLRANRNYNQTDAGLKARYRLIELMILTKDYASAEQHLDRLVVADNLRTQADGFYLYAKMMFDQGEFKEAKNYLNLVKARVVDHVEAAFLEGELNLLLPGGLQYTEVPVGNPRLSTVAIPGRELTLKLQDSNLAIARANSAIPVIVRTSVGGDEERLQLLPSPTDQNLFSGIISTSLGPVEKGNLKLELLGNDIVSYTIDPEFQKANSLNYPPKELEVRADGRLSASSGRILTEAEEEQRALEERMQAQQPQAASERLYRDGRTVRPGSNVYVQVIDFDRDISAKPDQVAVQLRTSSGDVVEAFKLTETGAHTGIFRGAVPTGIPLPKANASDTAEGSDPSVVINNAKPGLWSSLADGKKGKWFEVDTMSSHAVDRVELAGPELDQVRQVTLRGLLSDEYHVLATFPQRAGGNGVGLTGEYFADQGFEELVATRIDRMVAFRWDQRIPRPVEGKMMAVRWTGKVEPLYSERYTFHVYGDDGIRLWVNGQALIDEWRNSGEREARGSIELKAHELAEIKLEYYSAGGAGRAVLNWSSDSQTKQLVPQAYLFPATGEGKEVRDGVRIDIAYRHNGEQADRIARYLASAPTITYYADSPSFVRAESPWPWREWMTMRMRGTFYLPEATTLDLSFGGDPSPNNWQHAYLYINNELVLGGVLNSQSSRRSRLVRLGPGAHDLRVLMRDHFERSTIDIHYRQDDGTFVPLPAEWFSAQSNPALAEHLKPAARIALEEGRLVAKMEQPRRLRKLRWDFDDFAGNDVKLAEMVVIDADGQRIIPGPADFTTGMTNQILEIAPGDRITVSYEDEKRLREDTPVLVAELNSSYFNGEIMLANEVITSDPRDPSRRTREFFPAQRCRIGDQLIVYITDYDADVTDERDMIEVTVSTSSGQSVKLQALETSPYNDGQHNHAGVFMAVLKIGTQAGRDTIAVKPGDVIKASYLDSENTKPGVPIERVYTIAEGGVGEPRFTVYRTAVKQVEDTTAQARARLGRLSREQQETAVIMRNLILARHPDYENSVDVPVRDVDGKAVVDANAPLLFEVYYPKMALNSGSVLTVKARSQADIEAAAATGREPTVLAATTHVRSLSELAVAKGYPIQLQSNYRRGNREMLEEGVFAGVIRLQIGSPGDPVDDLVMADEKQFVTQEQRQLDRDGFSFRVPTLVVSGSDTVILTVEDEQGKVVGTQQFLLRSDARIELLDRTYTFQRESIYLGEPLFIRLTDPDQDRSSEQDSVLVKLSTTSGHAHQLRLVETLPHSGVFTGTIKPEFAEPPKAAGAATAPPPAPDTLLVNFGDVITLSFDDPANLRSEEPLTVTATATVREGFDARVVAFTKQFGDPEMAVKTRLLTAEALFEMAKQQRKLKQLDESAENIAEGKRILEEAMRDYPTTSLAAHGEFLLANLAEELENYQEAIGRFTQVIRAYPESEYASKSQFKMALCLEKMENYDQACEEYVKLTYIYPDSPLVAEATIRLASYYYQKNAFSVAAKIFGNFQERNSTHSLAPKALLLAAHCHMKMDDNRAASIALNRIVEQYIDDKEIRAEAMYWLGDAEYKRREYAKAYQAFKKLTWDYPESKWAKFARGRLTEEAMVKQADN